MAGSVNAVLADFPPSVEGTLPPPAEDAAAILAAALRGARRLRLSRSPPPRPPYTFKQTGETILNPDAL